MRRVTTDSAIDRGLSQGHNPDLVRTAIEAAARFADEVVAPQAATWERDRIQPEQALRRAIGLFSDIGIPEPLGGRGLGLSTVVQCYEELAARDLGFTCALAVHNAVTAAVTMFPNRDLMQTYLPALMSGDMIGAFSLTEPEVGSDAAAIRCDGTLTENGYKLTGQKAWVTNGAHADMILTFVQSDPSQRAKGIMGLVVERHFSGVSFGPPLDLFGSHAMGTTDLRFSETPVALDLVAFDKGQGFAAAMSGLDLARIGVAAMCNGALAGALEQASRYAMTRHAFGQRLFDNQGIQFPLANVATSLEASRALTHQAAKMLEDGQPVTLAAAHAKKYATKAAFDGISQCLQTFGANGLKEEVGLARQLAAARTCAFMDGTTEIQNLVIARALSTQFENTPFGFRASDRGEDIQ